MITTPSSAIASCLRQLTPQDWASLRAKSSTNKWYQLDWWHNKPYRDNPPNDGSSMQQPCKGEPEIPYERQLFYPSPNSRFSLGRNGRCAYFSSDSVINCCETMEQFSSNPNLSFGELEHYLNGEFNPTPDWYFYPLAFYLIRDVTILDVTTDSGPFFHLASLRVGFSRTAEVLNLVRSRDMEAKLSTQLIAIEAVQFGFDGIAYGSVRAPVDVGMLDSTLVVFNPEKVTSTRPSNITRYGS